jgi:hypothetical protein
MAVRSVASFEPRLCVGAAKEIVFPGYLLHSRRTDVMSRISDPEMLDVVLNAPVPSPPKKAAYYRDDVILVGYDTEWDSKSVGKPLLSVQFAVYRTNPDGSRGALAGRWYEPPGPRIQPPELVEYVLRFLGESDIKPTPKLKGRKAVVDIVLLAHFAQAELSMFENPFRDVVIEQIAGKAHHGKLHDYERDGVVFRVKLLDTFAFFKSGLGVLGKFVGLEKLDIGVDRTDLARLKREDPIKFGAYAIRDAEIVVAAYTAFREDVWTRWGVDPLQRMTLPAVAAEVLLRRFLKSAPVRSKPDLRRHFHKEPDGTWTENLQAVKVYGGPADRRIAACRSYHGGEADVFKVGFIEKPFVERDVKSLYPSATLIQPLPNESTKWFRVRNPQRGLEDIEGFGEVEFAFPAKTRYPCLPVVEDRVDRMVYPLRGTSWCTVAELRMARKFGAVINKVDLHVFKPGPIEINHDLCQYMRAFMDLKSVSQKGSVPYVCSKLFMNALVGKLAERRRCNSLLQLERMSQEQGFVGLAQFIAKSASFRASLRGLFEVGRVFVPEWACLIIGRARAVMTDLITKGALVVSTDSIIVPAGTEISCPGLEALRSVDSDMPVVMEADAVLIFRTRLYVLLQRVDNIRMPEGETPLAKDGQWAVVKLAGHGVPVDREACAVAVLESLAAKSLVTTPRPKTRLLSAESAVREGKSLNEEVTVARPPKFSLESKRSIVNRDVNPWCQSSETEPYDTIGRLNGIARQRATKAYRSQQEARSEAWRARTEAFALLGQRCYSLTEISKKTGIPKSTVAGLKNKMPWGEMEKFLASQKIAPRPEPDDDDDVGEDGGVGDGDVGGGGGDDDVGGGDV